MADNVDTNTSAVKQHHRMAMGQPVNGQTLPQKQTDSTPKTPA
jgi:hypothetical protein